MSDQREGRNGNEVELQTLLQYLLQITVNNTLFLKCSRHLFLLPLNVPENLVLFPGTSFGQMSQYCL